MKKYITDRKTLKEFLECEIRPVKRKFLTFDDQVIINKYIKLLRTTEYHQNCNHKIRRLFYLAQLVKLSRKYQMNVALNVFDKGLKIMHLGPILTNGNATVGKNCVLHRNTAIVSSKNKEPVIGDNVFIGYGATIMGGVKIENDTVIAAGAVVNKSFEEENITIAGVPAKKVKDAGTRNWRENK